jgi:phage/plasmid-like protein (TIGR03299 family)
MSANVENMMYVGEKPWHGLGVYAGEEGIRSKDALRLSGLDWKVIKLPNFACKNAFETTQEFHKEYIHNPESYSILRETDSKILGTVGKTYQPVQNSEAFEFLDSLIDDGQVKIYSAGSLQGGKLVWIQGKIEGNLEPLPNDISQMFISFGNNHDGKGSLKIFFTLMRIVCQNTWQIGLKEALRLLHIRHTGQIQDKIKAAKETLGLSKRVMDEYTIFAKALTQVQMDTQALESFVKALFPPKSDGGLTPQTCGNQMALRHLFEAGQGTEIPGVRGTAWGALNATTEFVNYTKVSTKSVENRLNSTWFGSGNTLIQRAHTYLNAILQGETVEKATQSICIAA